MGKLEISKEEELAILEEGVAGRFWLVLQSWLLDAGMTSGGAALSAKCEHREWQAGHASGLKQVLDRPRERIRDLKRFITEQKKQNS